MKLARRLPPRLLLALALAPLLALASAPASAQTVYGTATCSPQNGACDECYWSPGVVCNELYSLPAYPSCGGSTAQVSAPSQPSVIANPTLHVVHWGSYWASTGASLAAQDDTVWETLGTDWRFWQPLSEYSPGITYGPSSAIGFGATTVTTLTTGISTSPGATVFDYQVQAELQAELSSNVLPAPDGHRLYVIVLPPGVQSQYGFTGYHNALFADNPMVGYAVIASQAPTTISYPSYAFESNAQWRAIDSQISHEIYEATTDLGTPPMGWSTAVCGWASEVGDICEDFFSNPIDGYVVATFWSNQASGCVGPVDLDTSVPKVPAAPACGAICNKNKDTLFEECATLSCSSGQLCGPNHACHHCIGAAQCCTASGGVWDGKFCE